MKKMSFSLIPFLVLMSAVATASYSWQTLVPGNSGLSLQVKKLDKISEDFSDVKLSVTEEKFSSVIKNVTVIGDTGCRLKDKKGGGGSYQNCNDEKAWPFAKLIKSVAEENSDLIIHVGDYHYRESCAGLGEKCKEYSSAVGYGWTPWELDFFAPAKALLESKPWIFVRGNHEDCLRATKGWMALLSTNHEKDCKDFEDPVVLDLGSFVLINLDSTAIPDKPEFPDSELKKWAEHLDAVAEKLPKNKPVFVFTHKPIFGLAEVGKVPVPVNITFRELFLKSKLNDKVTAIFSGHIHSAQIARAKRGPVQVVSGHSGTALEDFKDTPGREAVLANGLENFKLVSSNFGYMTLQKGDKNWVVTFKDVDGKSKFSCDLTNHAQNCFSENSHKNKK